MLCAIIVAYASLIVQICALRSSPIQDQVKSSEFEFLVVDVGLVLAIVHLAYFVILYTAIEGTTSFKQVSCC